MFGVQFSVPFGPAMTKELTVKFTLAYDYKDFQDVVDDFVAGLLRLVQVLTSFPSRLTSWQANSKASKR